MTDKLQVLLAQLQSLLADKLHDYKNALGELTIVVKQVDWPAAAEILSQQQALSFRTCIDLAGVDYSTYAQGGWQGRRFAVVYHLLSIHHNWRLRVKVFCDDDLMPTMPTMLDVWPSVNWFEREAFDLFGIVFIGHPDLRRILTDYGFIGHPLRKDFPLSGYVEMRYDPSQSRVIYQPVTIEPRELTPRIVREEHYGG